MKKYILGFLLTVVFNSSYSQVNATVNSSGNYQAVVKAAKADKDTGKTYTDVKGNVFKVYVTEKGKLYIIRKSKKTGKEYKQYLTVK
jgi:hypothetical protein